MRARLKLFARASKKDSNAGSNALKYIRVRRYRRLQFRALLIWFHRATPLIHIICTSYYINYMLLFPVMPTFLLIHPLHNITTKVIRGFPDTFCSSLCI